MTTVAQILKRKGHRVHTVSPDALVRDALRLMAEHDIGALVVIETLETTPLGIFSERDYARRGILRGHRSDTTRVRELMTADPVTVGPDAGLEECMTLMTERRVRHLPVCEKSGSLVGLVSIGDIVKALLDEFADRVRSLEAYISGQ